jgi:uncharacterized protein (TIGR00296 family)
MENEQDLKLLCKYCFNVLTYALKNDDKEQPPEFPKQFIGKSYPLFVTWTTGKEKELRGCVGTFSKDILEKNLVRYTFISAFKDSRFPPISKNEITNLNCEVSLLVEFEKAKNPKDWIVGTHGIDIDFEDKNGNSYSATFLPEVAEEEKWDQETTLQYLIRKAGYRGSLESVYDNIKVTRYQSIKKTISYDEYKSMK